VGGASERAVAGSSLSARKLWRTMLLVDPLAISLAQWSWGLQAGGRSGWWIVFIILAWQLDQAAQRFSRISGELRLSVVGFPSGHWNIPEAQLPLRFHCLARNRITIHSSGAWWIFGGIRELFSAHPGLKWRSLRDSSQIVVLHGKQEPFLKDVEIKGNL
jgi:hypothetical protein